MHHFRTFVLIFVIVFLSSRLAVGEFPGLYIAEGTESPGRVLSFQNDGMERAFSRSNFNLPTHTSRIGSIEFVSSDEFYLCSGDDSVLIHRNRVGETPLHTSTNLIKQVRSDDSEEVWWSELIKDPKEEDLTIGSLWRWNERWNKPEQMHLIQKSKLKGNWKGAFDICKERILIATVGENTQIYDVTKSKSYRQVLETPIEVRSFRWDDSGQVWIVDNRGRLILLPNVNTPSRFQVALSSHTEFMDFDFQVAR